MAPRPGTYQAGFGAGELDRRVHGRTDIKQYYQGCSLMQRATPVPQAGFTNESLLGTQFIAEIRKGLVDIALTVTAFANPGVTLSTLLDLTTDKASAAFTGGANLVTVDCGSTVALGAFDLMEYGCATPPGGKPLRCDTSLDGVTWTPFGALYGFDGGRRSRRFALPPGQSRSARYIRVGVHGAAPGVITLRGVRAYAVGGSNSYRVRPFTRSRAEAYDLVLTVNNIDVWFNGVWKAAIPIALGSEQLETCDTPQLLDTMLLFHVDTWPQLIMRQGADDEWSCWFAPFRNLPIVDYGEAYGNGVPAIVTVNFVSLTLPASFALTVAGEETRVVELQSDTALNSAAIKAAVEDLPSVTPGITVAYDGTNYLITFDGLENQGDWSVTGRMLAPATTAVVVGKRQRGTAGGEALMGSVRGFPACGAFYQQRLIMAGFRSKPNAWIASTTGDYYDLNIDVTADTGAYLGAVDTVGSERIERVVFGTYLQFLTDEREYYLTDQALKRGQPPNIRLATSNGVRIGVPAVRTDTTTIFIHKNGGNIVEFVYSDAEQNYVGTNISVLSSSLLKGVRDLAFRGAVDADDAGALHVVNADGSMRVFVMLKSQDIPAAPGRFETDGLIRSVAVNGRDEVLIGVDRPVTAGTIQCLERISSTVPLDGWVRVTGAPTLSVTGLWQHEGRVVWVVADGIPFGPFTVTGGAITLQEAASDIYVGRWTPTDVRTLPVPKEVGEKTVVDRPVRPHTVRCNLLDTSSMAIGSETDGPFDVDLVSFGGLADVALLANPVSGKVSVEGLAGYSDDGKVILTQKRPGRMTVRDIIIETER